MKLVIQKPIVEHDLTHRVEPFEGRAVLLRPIANENVDSEIRRLYLDDCKSEGFVPGAVVVHTRISVEDRTTPISWGIILYLNTSITLPTAERIGPSKPWKPIRVKWVNGSFEDCNSQDLRVMMPVPELALLKRRAIKNEV